MSLFFINAYLRICFFNSGVDMSVLDPSKLSLAERVKMFDTGQNIGRPPRIGGATGQLFEQHFLRLLRIRFWNYFWSKVASRHSAPKSVYSFQNDNCIITNG